MFINEIYLTIQGESTYAGLPCVLVRLAGCNLECSWCDTPKARTCEGSTELTAEAVADRAASYECKLVEITGGEPLLQAETWELSKELLERDIEVLIETNGTISLEGLDKRIVKIVDVKCPSSCHAGEFMMENLERLSKKDQIKFVIKDRADYDYARSFYEEHLTDKNIEVLFSPVSGEETARDLAEWILADRLGVRLQLQLHRVIWKEEKEGLREV